MRIAVNSNITGKQQEKTIEYTYKFRMVDWTYKQIEEHIKQGRPICNDYTKTEWGKFHRKTEFFRSADFIGLDFDNKGIEKNDKNYFSLKNELLQGKTDRAKFLLNKSFLIYTSPNHSKERDKFRVLFHLPNRVTDINIYIKIQEIFDNYFQRADKNLKFPAVFFYGTSGKKDSFTKITNNRLTVQDIQHLDSQPIINKPKKKVKSKPKNTAKNQPKSTSKGKQTKSNICAEKPFLRNVNNILDAELEKLKQAQIGERDNVLNAVCYTIGKAFSGVEKEGRKLKNEQDFKDELKELAYKLGELDNFKSLTKEKIDKTIYRAIQDGKQKPMDFSDVNQKEKEIDFLNYEGYKTKNGYLTSKAKKKANEFIKDVKFTKDNFKEIEQNYKKFKKGEQDFVKLIFENKLIKMNITNVKITGAKGKEKDMLKNYANFEYMNIRSNVILSNLLEKHLDNKTSRQFANKNKDGFFQISKEINTHFPKVYKERITDSQKELAVVLNSGVFETFSITTESFTIELINKVLKILKNDQKAKQYYFALWSYASEKGSPDLQDVNINEIIKKMNPDKKLNKQQMYKERKQFIKKIKLLGSIIFFKERPTNEKGITDVIKLSLIGDFQIINEKKNTYFTGRLPRNILDKRLNIGDYYPNTMFKFTANETGAFNLAEALWREANRIMIGKKKGKTYETPNFNEKSIRWTKERVLQEVKTIHTPNATKRDKLLKQVFDTLIRLKIIRSYSGVPKNDKTKIKIVMFDIKNKK